MRIGPVLIRRTAIGLIARAGSAARFYGRTLALVVLVLCAIPTSSRASGADLHYRVWTIEEGLPQGSVRAIAQTSDGYLWIATLDGLVRFDGVQMIVFTRSEIPEMTSNRCLALLVDRRGTLWIGTEDGGILHRVGTTFRAYGRASGLQSDTILALAEDDEGNIWADTSAGPAMLRRDRWTPSGGTDVFPSTWTVPPGVQLPELPPDRRRLQNWPAWAPGAGGRIWVLDGGYLHRHENGTWRTFSNPVPSVVLPAANSLFEDVEGTIWIGSEQGLVQATPTPVRALVLPAPPAGTDLHWSNVYTLAEDASGRVWVGTQDEPHLLEEGTFTPLSTKPWWPRTWVNAIEPDTDGSILAASPSGLFRVWPGRGFEKLRGGPAAVDVHRDRHGTLWVATGAGLLRTSARGWDQIEGLPSDDVKVLLEGREGALWVGTHGGLARVDGEDVRAWTTADGLSSDRIRALYEDEAGALWIGTYDGGLNRFAAGTFVAIRKRDGLYDDGVFVILDDGAGRYYMCSNRGAFSVPKRELDAFASGTSRHLTFRSWNKTDGMPSSECNGGRQPSGFRAADGTLWFPTQRGIAIIDPRAVPRNTVPPRVVVEEVTAGRRTIPLGEPIVLAPGERRLEVHYTANTFIRPEGVRFRHRLAGFDDDWVEAGSRRFAQYTYIPPGEYVLTVLAANSDGVWSPEGVSLPIRVEPYWWQTLWFRGAVAVLALGILAAAYQRRVSSLTRRRAEQDAFARRLLESQEAERKRIAAELHDSLGQRLVIIKNLAMLATRPDSDGVRERVDEITAEASHAIAEVRDIAQNLRPHHLDRLGLTKALTALVRKAADASGIAVTADLDPIDGAFPSDAEIHMYRVVQETLNNVLKHAQASRASVTVRRSPERILLIVQDNGVGFIAPPPGGARPAGGGLGLTGITERVTLLGGRADIRSAPGQGTTVTITFDPRYD